MKSLLIFLSSVCVFLLFPDFIGASYSVVPPEIDIPDPGSDPVHVNAIIPGIIAYFISLTAVLAILGVTWGSIKMILAAGEDEKVKKGRLIIIYSFVGLIVSGLAYSVVTVITQLNFIK